MKPSAPPDAPRRLVAVAAFTLIAACFPAAAAAEDPHGPRNAISMSIFSVFGPGLTVEYERFVLPPRLSLVNALGFRSTGGHDYTTFTGTTTLEARFWLQGRAPFTRYTGRAMAGPFVAFREDVAWTLVHDDQEDRNAGTAIDVAETLSLGYRFVIGWFEASLLQGVTVSTQVDPRGRLAPITYVAAKTAGTLGVLF
jgi:hypothetical protein